MQLFDLKKDRGERNNLLATNRPKANELVLLLAKEVKHGRSSPGKPVPNDREVTFLPGGVGMPKGK